MTTHVLFLKVFSDTFCGIQLFLIEIITNIKVIFILLPLLDQLTPEFFFYPKDSY